MAIKPYEDKLKFTDYDADGDKIKWKIKNDVYELKSDTLDYDFPLLTGEITEDEETGIITHDNVSISFCPRGYFVDNIWCPPNASVVFSVAFERGASIVIYDEV